MRYSSVSRPVPPHLSDLTWLVRCVQAALLAQLEAEVCGGFDQLAAHVGVTALGETAMIEPASEADTAWQDLTPARKLREEAAKLRNMSRLDSPTLQTPEEDVAEGLDAYLGGEPCPEEAEGATVLDEDVAVSVVVEDYSQRPNDAAASVETAEATVSVQLQQEEEDSKS